MYRYRILRRGPVSTLKYRSRFSNDWRARNEYDIDSILWKPMLKRSWTGSTTLYNIVILVLLTAELSDKTHTKEGWKKWTIACTQHTVKYHSNNRIAILLNFYSHHVSNLFTYEVREGTTGQTFNTERECVCTWQWMRRSLIQCSGREMHSGSTALLDVISYRLNAIKHYCFY